MEHDDDDCSPFWGPGGVTNHNNCICKVNEGGLYISLFILISGLGLPLLLLNDDELTEPKKGTGCMALQHCVL